MNTGALETTYWRAQTHSSKDATLFLGLFGGCLIYLWLTDRLVEGRPRILRGVQIVGMMFLSFFLANYLGSIPPI